MVDIVQNEDFTPFTDEYTAGHFQKWLDDHVHEDDHETVTRQIKALLSDDPTWQGKYMWSELRRIAENCF